MQNDSSRAYDSADTTLAVTGRPPVNVEGAATHLGVTVRFVRRLIAERRLVLQDGAAGLSISPDELDRYMRSCLTPIGGRRGAVQNRD